MDETAAERRERVLLARQMGNGPRLYAALKPLAERLRQMVTPPGECATVGVRLSPAEAAAVLEAVDRVDDYDNFIARQGVRNERDDQ